MPKFKNLVSSAAYCSARFATLVLANLTNFFFCLLIFLLFSNWPVVCLARRHWLVSNLLRLAGPVAYMREGEGTGGGGDDTWPGLFTDFEGQGCGAAPYCSRLIHRGDLLSLWAFPFHLLFTFQVKQLRSFEYLFKK